jgi:hypothetical protein
MKELFPLRVFRRGGIVLAARAQNCRQSGRKAVKHTTNLQKITTYVVVHVNGLAFRKLAQKKEYIL